MRNIVVMLQKLLEQFAPEGLDLEKHTIRLPLDSDDECEPPSDPSLDPRPSTSKEQNDMLSILQSVLGPYYAGEIDQKELITSELL